MRAFWSRRCGRDSGAAGLGRRDGSRLLVVDEDAGLDAVGVAPGEGERRRDISAGGRCKAVDVDPREVTDEDDWTANREGGGLSELSMDTREEDSVGAPDCRPPEP